MEYKAIIAKAVDDVINKGVDYSDVHVARLETGWSLAYRQEPTDFVADKWFPLQPVNQIAGLYPKISKENAFTNKAGRWRPGTIPPQGDLIVDSPGSFVCQRYAYEMSLMADMPFVADAAYPLEYMTTTMVTDVLQLNKELILADNYFKASVWSTDWTGVASGETGTDAQTNSLTFRQFNDSDSDPIGTFTNAMLRFKKLAGRKPNFCLMGEAVYDKLRINPQLMSLYRNPQAADKSPTKLNEDMVATALDIDRLVVARAMYNTAKTGDTVSLDWIFGKGIWLGYVGNPAPMSPIAAVNVSFNQPFGGFDTALEQVPDLHAHTTYYQGFQCWAPVIVSADLGMFMASAVA
jgi:hypothetical protein